MKYCSKACRAYKPSETDAALEAAILALLSTRTGKSTICPSEAAREVAGQAAWRPLMEPARRAARRLVAAGKVVVTQRGRVVDPSTARGAIRIKRK